MNALVKFIVVAVIVLALDIPWLLLTQGWAGPMFKRIQGGTPMTFRLTAVPIVYLAIAYLLLNVTTDKNVFFVGAATYAIYDFTNYATLGKYELPFAIADTLWGGVIFTLSRFVLKKLKLLH